MNDLAAYLVAGLGALAAIVVSIWRMIAGAKKSGEVSEKLKAEQARREQREKADEADKDVDSLGADERRQRMRDNYRR